MVLTSTYNDHPSKENITRTKISDWNMDVLFCIFS